MINKYNYVIFRGEMTEMPKPCRFTAFFPLFSVVHDYRKGRS